MPTGWAQVGTTSSAGTGQSLSIYSAQYSAGLTLTFTNAASVAAWACQCYFATGAVVSAALSPAAGAAGAATMRISRPPPLFAAFGEP